MMSTRSSTTSPKALRAHAVADPMASPSPSRHRSAEAASKKPCSWERVSRKRASDARGGAQQRLWPPTGPHAVPPSPPIHQRPNPSVSPNGDLSDLDAPATPGRAGRPSGRFPAILASFLILRRAMSVSKIAA